MHVSLYADIHSSPAVGLVFSSGGEVFDPVPSGEGSAARCRGCCGVAMFRCSPVTSARAGPGRSAAPFGAVSVRAPFRYHRPAILEMLVQLPYIQTGLPLSNYARTPRRSWWVSSHTFEPEENTVDRTGDRPSTPSHGSDISIGKEEDDSAAELAVPRGPNSGEAP